MTLGSLTGLERQKLEEALAAIEAKVADLQGYSCKPEPPDGASSRMRPWRVKRRFGDERRTENRRNQRRGGYEDLIPREECILTLTNFGYVKRLPTDTYSIQNRGGRGVSV